MPKKQLPVFEKSSGKLVALFEEIAPNAPGVTQKKMFGWPCCFVNGNLFAGLNKQSMIFRISEKDRARCVEIDGVRDFEPMPGRVMKGYVSVIDPLLWERSKLLEWIARSLDCGKTLPAKGARKPPKKRAKTR